MQFGLTGCNIMYRPTVTLKVACQTVFHGNRGWGLLVASQPQLVS